MSGALVGADGAAWEPGVADRLHSLGADTPTVLAMGPDRLAESAADLGLRLGYHNHT